jgi:hypothetical protein
MSFRDLFIYLNLKESYDIYQVLMIFSVFKSRSDKHRSRLCSIYSIGRLVVDIPCVAFPYILGLSTWK